jgi:hypothetical protein
VENVVAVTLVLAVVTEIALAIATVALVAAIIQDVELCSKQYT